MRYARAMPSGGQFPAPRGSLAIVPGEYSSRRRPLAQPQRQWDPRDYGASLVFIATRKAAAPGKCGFERRRALEANGTLRAEKLARRESLGMERRFGGLVRFGRIM